MKRIRFRHKQAQKRAKKEIYPINEKIRASEVRVIDENGEMMGVLPTPKAIAIAKEKGLDLVAVSPKAEPPVAKFLNYGNFKYQQEKATKKQKTQQKKTEVKEIRLSPRIGKHDLDFRLNQAEKFLKKGDKVMIEVFLKGRERRHPELAKETIKNFIKSLQELIKIKIEQEIKKQGNKFSAIISLAPADNKEKNSENNTT